MINSWNFKMSFQINFIFSCFHALHAYIICVSITLLLNWCTVNEYYLHFDHTIQVFYEFAYETQFLFHNPYLKYILMCMFYLLTNCPITYHWVLQLPQHFPTKLSENVLHSLWECPLFYINGQHGLSFNLFSHLACTI